MLKMSFNRKTVVDAWNVLPQCVINAVTVNSFNMFKAKIMTSRSNTCYMVNCNHYCSSGRAARPCCWIAQIYTSISWHT